MDRSLKMSEGVTVEKEEPGSGLSDGPFTQTFEAFIEALLRELQAYENREKMGNLFPLSL